MIDLLTPQQTEWLTLTLLHSLWQSLTLAILLSLVLRIIPAARASLRYLICLAALLSIPVCVLATWSWLNIRSLSHPESVGNSNVLDMPVPVVRSGFAWEEGCVVVWVIGVALMTLRIMFAFFQLQTLRNQSKAPDESIVQLVERLLKNDFLVRRVEILTTDKLTTAAVAGLFRPVLFISAAMVTGLSERQLEAVLAHELAHIRRFDVVANLVQMLVEAGLFFNPAVWWISRQVRQEREACCDVAGVQASGDAAFYSETLATWAEQLRQLSGSEMLPAGAIGFAAERKSTLVQRIRRILFPHDVPKSHFSPWSTICLLLLGAALFGGLWKGTQIAVAIVDELLPHEVVVEELTRKREEFGGDQLPIVREIKNEGSMELDIRLKTPNGKPTNSVVRVSYATFEQHGHTSNSAAGNLAWLDVGEMQQTKELKFSWAHLMFLSKGYAPVVIRDVKPDESGKAVVNVDLDPGYDGLVEVKDEAGEPVSHVKFTLNHVLKYPRKTAKQSRSMQSSGGGSTSTRAGEFESDENGKITVSHVNDQPNFSAKLECEGFETTEITDLSWNKGETKTIVLSRGVPIEGKVVDGYGSPLYGVEIYEVTARCTNKKHVSRSTSNTDFCGKEFYNPVAITDADGGFVIRSFRRDWKYALLADAGERGYQAIPYVSPGDSDVHVTIAGPIDIRGTVSGNIERLKSTKRDAYELRYGLGLLVDTGRRDSTGRIPLNFVDGKATFELKNVVPGEYEFSLRPYERLVRNLEVTKSISDLEIVVPEKKEEKKRPKQTTTERLVRLSLQPVKGVAKFRGRISIHSRSKDSSTYHSRPIDVVDDQVEFPVNAPSKVTVEMMDAPGFLFEDGVDLEFEVGADSDEPVVRTASVFPGGVIYGRLSGVEMTDSDLWLGVIGETAWRTEKSYRSTSVSRQCDEDGRFFIDHLPYGSTTGLIARHGSWCKPLDPIQVDSTKPQAEVQVKIAKGPTLAGTLMDSEGNPVSEMEIDLLLFTSEHQKYFAGSLTTDRGGAFSFGMINPDAGEHFVRVVPARDYAPVFLAADASSPVNMQLQSGGIVEGRLLDETGKPVSNAEVYAMIRKFRSRAVHGLEAEAKTDEEGRFRFSNLGDEVYELNTRVLRRQVVEKIVRPGDRQVELRLKPLQ